MVVGPCGPAKAIRFLGIDGKHLVCPRGCPTVPSARSVARGLLAIVGIALMGFAVLIGASVWGATRSPPASPSGSHSSCSPRVVPCSVAPRCSPGTPSVPAQRAGLKLAGALAVAAFVIPVVAVFAVPELLFDWFDAPPFVGALVAWFSLSTAAFAVGVVVALWRAGELAYASATS